MFDPPAPRPRTPDAVVRLAIDEHLHAVVPRLDRLWAYYRNPLEPVTAGGASARPHGRWYTLAQECGLPARIVGPRPSNLLDDRSPAQREPVVENDIAWRIHTMVDFMFGRPIRIRSDAPDPGLRAQIERVLDRVWRASGGITLLQDVATLGSVFGHVDLLLRVDEEALLAATPDRAAEALRVEPVDARRGIPVVSPHDYRELDA